MSMSGSHTSTAQLCACGSGLTAQRCCALVWERQARGQPAPAELEAAAAALRRGDERPLLTLIERSPLSAPALGMLYEVRAGQRRSVAAEALLRRLVRLDPNHPGGAIALAALLLQRGALAEAETHARNAVRLAPTHPMSHSLMGMIMTEARRPQVAEHHYRRAAALTPKPDAAFLANFARCLTAQGKVAEARELFGRSIALEPNGFKALVHWARLEEADRQFDRAGELLDAAEAAAPGHPQVALQRAVLERRLGRCDAALARLDAVAAALAGTAADPGFAIELLNERGVVLDKLGRSAEAFEIYRQAKQAMVEMTGQTYMAAEAAELAGRLAGFFTAERAAQLPRAAPRADTAQPIFILGFPRSGTTMVEQTLSAHPQISAGDELPAIQELSELAPRLLNSPLSYPEALVELWMGDQSLGLDTLRDLYLQRARQLGAIGEGADWFTDKMPLNETHLGLIGLVFPQAPLIHVLRHPLDVVLSTFANPMTHGFHCASDLQSIARHYVLIADLVERTRRAMPLRYLAVRYEDIVADQQACVREMLDFVGVAFESACLAFHENRRYARTASYAQVSEPLHDRSVHRWRAYRDQLAPVIPILEPVIRRLGYGID